MPRLLLIVLTDIEFCLFGYLESKTKTGTFLVIKSIFNPLENFGSQKKLFNYTDNVESSLKIFFVSISTCVDKEGSSDVEFFKSLLISEVV